MFRTVAFLFLRTLTLSGALLLLTSCGLLHPPGYVAPPGYLYQNSSLNLHMNTPNRLGSRTGESCVVGYLWLVSVGDGSVQAAAAAGGIREIMAVDYRTMNILGSVYSKVCTIVHGE